MWRIFLSSAPDDDHIVERLKEAITEVVDDVAWWQSPRASEPEPETELQVAGADLFIAVLSPQYLTSPTCRRERSLAMQREYQLDVRFLHVVVAADTPYAEAGSLRRFRPWLEARPPLDDVRLTAITAGLPLREPRVKGATQGAAVSNSFAVFRNRHDELGILVNRLTTRGGRDLWTVVSPPLLGKSWLVDQLPRALVSRDPRWVGQLLDLREHPRELRHNPSVLLSTLFGIDIERQPDGALLPTDDIRRIVATITTRPHLQLYIIDSADLLGSDCAIHTRSALTAIYRLVQQSGNREVRLSFVIGTRRHDDWRGLGHDPTLALRFEALWLTPFGADVVEQALAELSSDLTTDERWACAKRLHDLSEGLPALLGPSLRWAERNGFRIPDAIDDAAFDEIASSYIRNDLLSAESLLPAGATDPDRALALLHRMLAALSPYRFFTQSHVRHHLDLDPEAEGLRVEMGWSHDDLWDALGRMSLCGETVAELWLVIAPPIRRLLYRHYHRTKGAQISSHVQAREFYEGWTEIRNAGREQPVVLIECLWHEASRLIIERPGQVAHALPTNAKELTYKFTHSPIYGRTEFSEFVGARLDDDEEFQLLLQDYDGLFKEVVKTVAQTVGERG